MPIYEYQCSQCGETIDVLQKVDEPAPEKCEKCGAAGTLSKMVSRTSFVLKGGGWYSDLYSSTKKDTGGSKDPAPASSSPTTSTSKPGESGTTSSTAPAPSSGTKTSGGGGSG